MLSGGLLLVTSAIDLCCCVLGLVFGLWFIVSFVLFD